MSLNNSHYYVKDEHYYSGIDVLSCISTKPGQPSFSQSVTGSQGVFIGQNIRTAVIYLDAVSTVGNWEYQSKIIASSLQRVHPNFEKSNDYSVIPLSSRSYFSTPKNYRRIAELGANNETYKYSLEWLKTLREVISVEKMWWRDPLVNLGIESEIVFEWWHNNKKLTVYILGNTAEYIKVWGADIDNEMEDGSVTSPAELTGLWKWLIS